MIFKNIEDSEVKFFDGDVLFNSQKEPDTIVAPNTITIGVTGESETISESSLLHSTIVTPEVDLPIKVYNSNLIEITKSDYLLKNKYLSEYSSESDKEIVRDNLGITNEINNIYNNIIYILEIYIIKDILNINGTSVSISNQELIIDKSNDIISI